MQTSKQTNIPNKKAVLECILEKTKIKSLQERNLINLQSSGYLDATKYISLGLNCQQNEDFQNSKINMDKGLTLIKEILNNDQIIQSKNNLPHEYVIINI